MSLPTDSTLSETPPGALHDLWWTLAIWSLEQSFMAEYMRKGRRLQTGWIVRISRHIGPCRHCVSICSVSNT